MSRLDEKIAVVTGATSGIGRAIAELFGREGARVVVVGRNSERGHIVVENIESAGSEAMFIRSDVSAEADCRNMISQTIDRFGRLDILVNNAGTTSTIAIEDAEEEEFDRIIATNLKAIYFACKYAIPIMKNQKKGVIITVSSKGGLIPTNCSAIYAASKAGATQLTQAIGVNYGKFGIRANTILPSYIDTPMTDEFIERTGKDYGEAIRALEEETPLGRIGTPEDCANAALFLASDESSFVNATPLIVDGGVIFS